MCSPHVRHSVPRTALALALSAGLVAASAAWGSQPAGFVPREERNGAMKYWEAWATMSAELSKKVADVDWDALAGITEWGALPESFRGFEQEPVGSIADAIANAASYKRCNFEMQWEDGAMTLMPHLSKMRSGARLLRVAARMDLAKGRPDAAVDRVVTEFKCAQAAAQDPVLISSLVGTAITDLALSEVQVQAASGKVTAGGKAKLLGALRAVNTDDPMNTRASIQGELDTFVPWVEKQFEGGKPSEQLMGLLDMENGVRKDEARAYFAGLTRETFRGDIERIRLAFKELTTLWDTPDARRGLDEFDKKVNAGEFGMLARYFLPTVGKAKTSQDNLRARLTETIRQVENMKPAK
ncbi:MAG: hypothetical protein U0637_04520 [Phycisphaerales bacterium]